MPDMIKQEPGVEGMWLRPISELNLWAAVMCRAVKDLIIQREEGGYRERGDGASQNEMRHTREWIESNATNVGDFRWICQELQIECIEEIRRIAATGTMEDYYRIQKTIIRG